MKEKRKPEEFELEVLLYCKKCGMTFKADGYYIYHKTGTVSFVACNVNEKCPFCRIHEKIKPQEVKVVRNG